MDNSVVSVVIPVCNVGTLFERILQAIRQQVVPGREIELVVVDSGSTDGTPDRARRYGANVICIPKEEFNHGATRNLGISHTHGSLVCLFVGDACPIGTNWLQALIDAVDSDPEVAGAYSRQLPWPEDDALMSFLVNQWHRVQGEQRVVQALPPGGMKALPYPERRKACAFDDVSSMMRREVWDRFPFRPLQFAEDIGWSTQVMQAGHKIVYAPESQVYHSHNRNAAFHARRQYVDEWILMDLLEADESTIKSWSSPTRCWGLVALVLAQARRDHTLTPGLIGHLAGFVPAIFLGSLARRIAHPYLRAGNPPGWVRGIHRRFARGV
jgi:rhamnosyltransferase